MNSTMRGTLVLQADAGGPSLKAESTNARAAVAGLDVRMLRLTLGFQANAGTPTMMSGAGIDSDKAVYMSLVLQHHPLQAQSCATLLVWMSQLRLQLLIQMLHRHRPVVCHHSTMTCILILTLHLPQAIAVVLQTRLAISACSMMKDHRGPSGTWVALSGACVPRLAL